MMALEQEAKKCSTLFGIEMRPRAKGYNGDKALEAEDRLEDMVKTYSSMLIRERDIEAMEEPYSRDLAGMIGNNGLIERCFDSAKRDSYQELEQYVSLSDPPDIVEGFCLGLIQRTVTIYDRYIIGSLYRVVLGEERPANEIPKYGVRTKRATRLFAGAVMALAVVPPIIALAVIQSMEKRIIITILATCINFPLYNLFMPFRAHLLVPVCAALTALYVVFISNNTVILPA